MSVISLTRVTDTGPVTDAAPLTNPRSMIEMTANARHRG